MNEPKVTGRMIAAVLVVRLWVVWSAVVLGLAVFWPRLVFFVAVPVVAAVAFRFGQLTERHLMPAMRVKKPWVPLPRVVLDVSRAIESAQSDVATRWLWQHPRGVDVDYAKLAEIAVDSAAQSAFKHQRDERVREFLGET